MWRNGKKSDNGWKEKKNLVEESTEKKNQKLCKYETEKKRFLWKIHIIMHYTVPDESFKAKVILGFVEYIMYNCL